MTDDHRLDPTDPGPIKTVTLSDVPVWLSVLWAVAVVGGVGMLLLAIFVELQHR